MSMNEFRRLAAKIDQHMQQLAAQGVSETHSIINRMVGYVPDLHKIRAVPPTSNSWRCLTNYQGSTATPSSWKRYPKPSATRHRVPMTAWPSSPKSTSNAHHN